MQVINASFTYSSYEVLFDGLIIRYNLVRQRFGAKRTKVVTVINYLVLRLVYALREYKTWKKQYYLLQSCRNESYSITAFLYSWSICVGRFITIQLFHKSWRQYITQTSLWKTTVMEWRTRMSFYQLSPVCDNSLYRSGYQYCINCIQALWGIGFNDLDNNAVDVSLVSLRIVKKSRRWCILRYVR